MTDLDLAALAAAPPEDPDLAEQETEAVPVPDAEPGTITDEQITGGGDDGDPIQ